MLCENMKNTDKWEIDRKSSKKEKILGIFLSGIFCIFSMVMCSGSVILLYIEGVNKSNLIFTSATLFLLFVSLYLLFIFICTPPKRPSKISIKIVPYFFIFSGVGMIILSYWAKENPFAPLSLGLIGISGGITMLNRKKFHKNT